jgi:DNA-binding response OmpR family regulator
MRRDHVLVIDDEEITLDLLRIALEKEHFKVSVAKNWAEVMDCVKDCYGEKQKFDAIILDLMMPERSGFDMLRSLQVVMHPIPPVIVLSAVTDVRSQLEASDLGVAKYITKPTSPHILVQCLREVMHPTI